MRLGGRGEEKLFLEGEVLAHHQPNLAARRTPRF
jgi:hypothetical protein